MQQSQITQRQNNIRLIISIFLIVILTSIHHIYGAIHYKTPWRLHTLHINIPMLLIVYLLIFHPPKKIFGSQFIRGLTIAIITIVWICWLGLYEAFYNHLVKNILYFSSEPKGLMSILFPLKIYEMPNDFIFEVTGILQLLPLPYIFLYTFKKAFPKTE